MKKYVIVMAVLMVGCAKPPRYALSEADGQPSVIDTQTGVVYVHYSNTQLMWDPVHAEHAVETMHFPPAGGRYPKPE